MTDYEFYKKNPRLEVVFKNDSPKKCKNKNKSKEILINTNYNLESMKSYWSGNLDQNYDIDSSGRYFCLNAFRFSEFTNIDSFKDKQLTKQN